MPALHRSNHAGTRLVRHGCVTSCGWRLSTTAYRDTGSAKSSGEPHRRNAGRVHRLVGRDGSIIEGKRIDLAERFGIRITSMSSTLTALAIGRLAHYRGYTIAPEAA